MAEKLLKSHQTETKKLIISEELLENLTFKLLSDVIFQLLPCQSDIPSFTINNLY